MSGYARVAAWLHLAAFSGLGWAVEGPAARYFYWTCLGLMAVVALIVWVDSPLPADPEPPHPPDWGEVDVWLDEIDKWLDHAVMAADTQDYATARFCLDAMRECLAEAYEHLGTDPDATTD